MNTMNLNQITLPALDLDESVSFYRRMGFIQIVDSSHYARFECPEGDATFSVHQVEQLHADSGVVVYFETAELDQTVEKLRSDGYHFHKLPSDERWLWREARLRDPAGNQLCFYWAGDNRKNPPWKVANV